MILRLAIEIEQQKQIIVPLQLIAPTHREMSIGVHVVEGGAIRSDCACLTADVINTPRRAGERPSID